MALDLELTQWGRKLYPGIKAFWFLSLGGVAAAIEAAFLHTDSELSREKRILFKISAKIIKYIFY